VLAHRATLYLALQAHGKRTKDESKALAQENVAAALQRDPGNFWAHQVNFFYFDTLPSAVDLAKESTASQKDNWLAWVWYAEVLRKAKKPLDDRRVALAKALDLAPNSAIALTQMSWVEAGTGNWKAALENVERAIRSPPVASDTVVAYTVALSHSGRCGDARVVEEQLTKRLKNDIPKDIAGILSENHKVCTGDTNSTGTP
jgi:tetratricopeptide (TPR) repeat protein